MVRAKCRTRGVRGVYACMWCNAWAAARWRCRTCKRRRGMHWQWDGGAWAALRRQCSGTRAQACGQWCACARAQLGWRRRDGRWSEAARAAYSGACGRRKAADGGACGRRKAADDGGGDRSEGEGEGSSGKRKRVRGRRRAREKYDMWTPKFFISPVDPTLRF
jgi:hypothetical protein